MLHENYTNQNTTFRGATECRNVRVARDTKSPYWAATFVGPDGRRVKKSTKVPVEGGLFRGEKLTKAQAKNRAIMVAAEIARAYEGQNGSSTMTVRELFDLMLSGKLGRVSVATYNNARNDYKQFCSWLGEVRANRPAALIRRKDALAWLVDRRASVRRATCRKSLTALRAAFNWAVDAELLPGNPFLNLRVQPDTKDEKVVHEAFSWDEIKLLVAKLPEEWSRAVMCCIGTYGQRLGDVLALRWEQFDWQGRVVRMVTGKTARVLMQPMQDWFYTWAFEAYSKAQHQGGDAAIWVMPKLRLHSNPSAEFTQLVRLHGIGLVGAAAGGRRRTWHSKTFHSLRASVATMLQASGVSQGMAMELVGHESAAVHAAYIRPSADLLYNAAMRLPEL